MNVPNATEHTLKNGQNDIFYVLYSLSQFKEIPPNEGKICFRKTKAEKTHCQQAYTVRRVEGNSSDGGNEAQMEIWMHIRIGEHQK